MEEEVYKVSKQFKETLLAMLTKSVMSTIMDTNEDDVYSIDEGIENLDIGIDDMGELLILNPPEFVYSEKDLKSLDDKVQGLHGAE